MYGITVSTLKLVEHTVLSKFYQNFHFHPLSAFSQPRLNCSHVASGAKFMFVKIVYSVGDT